MGTLFDAITPALGTWLMQQHLFFVATAPLAEAGLVNCSPKGMDTFRILGPKTVAYLDLTGSGVETIAHLRENGRIVFMFCAFDGLPKIVRLHGTGVVITPESAGWSQLAARFPAHQGARAVIQALLSRVSDSCGYAVPTMSHVADRDVLTRHHATKGPAGLQTYRNEKNARSLDGLPGLEPRGLTPP